MWAAGFMYSWKKMEVAQLALSPLRVELRHNTTTWVFDCHRTVKSMHMCFVKVVQYTLQTVPSACW